MSPTVGSAGVVRPSGPQPSRLNVTVTETRGGEWSLLSGRERGGGVGCGGRQRGCARRDEAEVEVGPRRFAEGGLV